MQNIHILTNRKVLSVLAMFLFIMCVPISTNAQKLFRVTAQKVNVRNKPSTQSSIVGSLVKNDTIRVVSVKNGWATFVLNMDTRYVSARYLEEIDEPTTQNEYQEEASSELQVSEEPMQQSAVISTEKSKPKASLLSGFPAWSIKIKYIGEIHTGYTCSTRVDGLKTYTATAEIGTIQGIALNEYVQFAIGVDAIMYTHHYKYQDMRFAVAPYGMIRGFMPISTNFSPFLHLALGADIMVHPSGGGHLFFCEFGPGFRYKKFNFFCGLQHVGKGQGSNHFFAKLGWYF